MHDGIAEHVPERRGSHQRLSGSNVVSEFVNARSLSGERFGRRFDDRRQRLRPGVSP
jgi:hypothetical protein